jgi:hypothetical protein
LLASKLSHRASVWSQRRHSQVNCIRPNRYLPLPNRSTILSAAVLDSKYSFGRSLPKDQARQSRCPPRCDRWLGPMTLRQSPQQLSPVPCVTVCSPETFTCISDNQKIDGSANGHCTRLATYRVVYFNSLVRCCVLPRQFCRRARLRSADCQLHRVPVYYDGTWQDATGC